MKTDSEMNRIRNTAERQIYGRTRQNTGRGRYLALLVFVIGGGFSALLATPASAQSPTVTPFPGPAATATAAANQQAQAAAQRNQANALTQQAAALSSQADANYSAAAQAASDARAALSAQQAGAAGEAIGRAEANITNGKAQLSELRGIPDQLNAIIQTQAGTIVMLTVENQQLRIDKQTAVNAASAALDMQEQSDRNSTLLRIVGTFIAFVFFVMLIVFMRDRLRARAMRADDGGAADEAEIIDNEA